MLALQMTLEETPLNGMIIKRSEHYKHNNLSIKLILHIPRADIRHQQMKKKNTTAQRMISTFIHSAFVDLTFKMGC